MSRFARLCAPVSIILLAFSLAVCQPSAPETEAPTSTSVPVATGTPAPAATAAAAASTDASADAAAAPQPVPLLEMVARAEGLEDFVSYAQSTGLAEQLQAEGPFTLFVAPNAAFAALPEQVRTDADIMAQIMAQQLLAGAYMIQDLIDAGNTPNVEGTDITVFRGATGGTVNGANILGADFVGKNGVIHVIDTLLLPSELQDEIMALYPAVAGEETYPMQGNIHIDQGATSPVVYNSTPPTSGPHFANIVAWQVYDKPFVYEQLIHNLEDSGIIIYYQCAQPCPDLVQQLREFVQPYMEGGRHVVVVPNDPAWTDSCRRRSARRHGRADCQLPPGKSCLSWTRLMVIRLPSLLRRMRGLITM